MVGNKSQLEFLPLSARHTQERKDDGFGNCQKAYLPDEKYPGKELGEKKEENSKLHRKKYLCGEKDRC